jgi:hypothetical protein
MPCLDNCNGAKCPVCSPTDIFIELAQNARGCFLEENLVPCVNVPMRYSMDAGLMLLHMYPEAPFVLTYFINGRGDKEWFMLADNTRTDVCEIAKHLNEGVPLAYPTHDSPYFEAKFTTLSHYQWPTYLFKDTYAEYLYNRKTTKSVGIFDGPIKEIDGYNLVDTKPLTKPVGPPNVLMRESFGYLIPVKGTGKHYNGQNNGTCTNCNLPESSHSVVKLRCPGK